jgi:hypothetical protein
LFKSQRFVAYACASGFHHQFFAGSSWCIEVAVYVYDSSTERLGIVLFAGEVVEVKRFAEVEKLQVYVVVEMAEHIVVAKAHLQVYAVLQRA